MAQAPPLRARPLMRHSLRGFDLESDAEKAYLAGSVHRVKLDARLSAIIAGLMAKRTQKQTRSMKHKIILVALCALLGGKAGAQTYAWTTIAGLPNTPAYADGTNNAALFNNPQGVAVDGAGNVFVADANNYCIRKISLVGSNWVTTTIAGLAGSPGFVDGQGSGARFNNLTASTLKHDGLGNLYVQDYNGAYFVRKISLVGTNWVVTTIYRLASSSNGWTVDLNGNCYTSTNFTVIELSPVLVNGIPSQTNFTTLTLAGVTGLAGSTDGTNSVARFSSPSVFAVDSSGTIYLADQNYATGYFPIRTVAVQGGNTVTTTLNLLPPTNAVPSFPFKSLDYAGNIYGSPWSYTDVQNGTNFSSHIFFWQPATPNAVSFGGLKSTTALAGVAVGPDGTVYVADSGASVVRQAVPTSSMRGNLQITLLNSNAVTAGAAWRVDAGLWQTNGSTVSNLMTGSNHVLSFAPVYGWGTPPNQWVTIAANATTKITGTYVQQLGSLQVNLTPASATNGGALWQVDGGPWQASGTVVSNLSLGLHTVAFNNLTGFITPATQSNVTILPNQTTVIAGAYVALGAVSASINPAGAVLAGAQWQFDGGTLLNSGVVISNVSLGSHFISFVPVTGFITPGNLTVTVASGQTTNVSANYVALGNAQVTLTPSNVVTAGAQWSLDAGGWQDSGMVLSNLALGAHTISYLPVSGWITPSNQIVNVLSGQTTNVSATYIATGTVQVFITPPGAVSAGAVWRVDSNAWQASGLSATGLVVGTHAVSFTNLAGWTTPSNQTVAVNLNQTTVATGVYIPQFGNLQVVLSPAGAVSEGAQWQVDAGASQVSGSTLTNVAVGSHTVTFASLAGWTSPSNQTVTIASGQTTRLTAIYQGQGSLQVFLTPTGAVLSGAQWQVDGGAWTSNGTVVTGLSRGAHTVSYKTASGWVAPASQLVNVLANQTTVTNGLYTGLGYNFTTIAGTVGTNAFADGLNLSAWFSTPVGICVGANGNLYVADTGNSVIRKLTPVTNGWVSSTIAGLAGFPGNADGTNSQARFDYPSGVTVDANGNLYVADQVNSTVRELSTDGTNWTVFTIAGLAGNYGSANGTNSAARFYYPAGIAVDTAGNLYVADQINSTIRKLTPLGSNNWAVTTIAGTTGVNGSTDGPNSTSRFYWPSDLTVDAGGNVFVADTFNNTIRKLSPVGASYVATTLCGIAGVSGSMDGTNITAVFDGPGGIALDAFGNLLVADSYSAVIRKITPVGSNWVVNTVGGLAYASGSADGAGSGARFAMPSGVGVDSNGVIYVADTYNQTVRAGSPLATSPARPNILSVLGGGNFAFTWQAQAGSLYQVQVKTNLLQAAWLDLGSSVLGTNAVMLFADPAATTGQRFYRVKLLP